MRGSARRASQPAAMPIAAPAASSNTSVPINDGACTWNGVSLNTITRMTVGASLKPDSASSRPAMRRGSGSARSTANTAAASVEDTTAPISSDTCQSKPRNRCAPRAVTSALTPTPTVASTPAGASTVLMSPQLVVRPPSIRMIASAAVPRFCATWALSKRMPSTSSPSSRPTAR